MSPALVHLARGRSPAQLRADHREQPQLFVALAAGGRGITAEIPTSARVNGLKPPINDASPRWRYRTGATRTTSVRAMAAACTSARPTRTGSTM
jgi:hypothetical protein